MEYAVLTQQERQDLFILFGNSGTAPIGYGGQGCEGGHVRGTPKVYYQQPVPPDPEPSEPVIFYGWTTQTLAPGKYAKILVQQLNVRSGPSLNDPVVGVVILDNIYPVIAESGTWGQIQDNTATTLGWSNLDPIYADVFEAESVDPVPDFPPSEGEETCGNYGSPQYVSNYESPVCLSRKIWTVDRSEELGIAVHCIVLDDNPLGYGVWHTVYTGWSWTYPGGELFNSGWNGEGETIPAYITNQWRYIECGIPGI